jgi:hypothetical protein
MAPSYRDWALIVEVEIAYLGWTQGCASSDGFERCLKVCHMTKTTVINFAKPSDFSPDPL